LKLKGVTAKGGLKPLAKELLERVNLTFAAKRAVKSYSGGMRQRLGIAQAIAGNPRVVIVDEPTAGLDPEERLRFYHLLAELAEDRTVVLSTHIVEDVAVLCPRFAAIRSGRLVAKTTPRQARESIAGLIFEGSVPPAELAELRRQRVVTQALLVEGRHRVRIFAPNGDAPAGFERVEPSLEDAYLVLMRTELAAVAANGDRAELAEGAGAAASHSIGEARS
jgi:ABC-type multidrug transport system ATPase subunit